MNKGVDTSESCKMGGEVPDEDRQNPNPFSVVPSSPDAYTDNRKPGDWRTRYPSEACRQMKLEAVVLSLTLLAFLTLCGLTLGISGQPVAFALPWISVSPTEATAGINPPILLKVDCNLLSLFFAGSVGGTTFSIKWLVHSVAKGKWHLDRRYWRMFVPYVGGTYACVVITLLDAGFFSGGTHSEGPRSIALSAALAFLVGYFSDGVSGLLSNVANAVFGTLEKK